MENFMILFYAYVNFKDLFISVKRIILIDTEKIL